MAPVVGDSAITDKAHCAKVALEQADRSAGSQIGGALGSLAALQLLFCIEDSSRPQFASRLIAQVEATINIFFFKEDFKDNFILFLINLFLLAGEASDSAGVRQAACEE